MKALDMSLPVMDGWEATQQLKGNSKTRNIPLEIQNLKLLVKACKPHD